MPVMFKKLIDRDSGYQSDYRGQAKHSGRSTVAGSDYLSHTAL